MNNLNSGKGKFNKFIMGKGFYVALAICLIGAGAAAWVSVDKTLTSIQTPPLAETPSAQTQQAEQKIENVTKPTTPQAPPQTEAQTPVKTPAPTSQEPQVQDTSSQPSSGDSTSSQVSSSASAVQPESVAQSKPSAQPQNVQTSSFVLPVGGQLLGDFSGETLVKNVTLNDWRTHNGVDIKAVAGSDVNAASSGTVTKISTDPLWGNVVEVTSGSRTIYYCGLADPLPVKMNDMISTGQVVGQIGIIPCESTLEAHIHLEVKDDGKYKDPMSLVSE